LTIIGRSDALAHLGAIYFERFSDIIDLSMSIDSYVSLKMTKETTCTRAVARASGYKHYYSGESCRAGHVAERYTSTAQCVECKRTQYKSSVGKSRKAAHAKKYRESEKGRHYRLLENAKRRAIKKNLEFSLTLDDILIPKFCPLIGIEIQLGGDGLFNMNSPSLDRIDNSQGYVRGNVAVISLKANKIKSDLSILELQFLAHSLLRYVGQEGSNSSLLPTSIGAD
jgi:hypothetical protein